MWDMLKCRHNNIGIFSITPFQISLGYSSSPTPNLTPKPWDEHEGQHEQVGEFKSIA